MNLINGAGPNNPGGNDEIGWWTSVNSLLSLIVPIPSDLVMIMIMMMIMMWTGRYDHHHRSQYHGIPVKSSVR